MKTLERMCSECEEPISTARLKEKPNTALCVACKTKLEKQPKARARENPAKIKEQKRRLPERLANLILTLPQGKEITANWHAEAGSELAKELAKHEARIKRLEAAFARKDLFDPAKLLKIRDALRQAKGEVASIVSKAMSAQAKKLRDGLRTINAKLDNKKAVLSVDSKNRKFRFSIEEKQNLDEVDTMLSEAGIG